MACKHKPGPAEWRDVDGRQQYVRVCRKCGAVLKRRTKRK